MCLPRERPRQFPLLLNPQPALDMSRMALPYEPDGDSMSGIVSKEQTARPPRRSSSYYSSHCVSRPDISRGAHPMITMMAPRRALPQTGVHRLPYQVWGQPITRTRTTDSITPDNAQLLHSKDFLSWGEVVRARVQRPVGQTYNRRAQGTSQGVRH
jgi:hypothetical protein